MTVLSTCVYRDVTVLLGGDANASILFGHLLSCFIYSSQPDPPDLVVREGVLWLAKSYTALVYETGLTLQSIRSALAHLEKAGLIAIENFSFDHALTDHIRHLRLNVAAFPARLTAQAHHIIATIVEQQEVITPQETIARKEGKEK